jgi:hypothetical protein
MVIAFDNTPVRTIPVRHPLANGEPLITAAWKAVTAVVGILTVLTPVLALCGSRHWRIVPIVIVGLYATAIAASCLYNKLLYGRALPYKTRGTGTTIALNYPPNGRRPRRKLHRSKHVIHPARTRPAIYSPGTPSLFSPARSHQVGKHRLSRPGPARRCPIPA